jgi:hypothetical protein
MVMETLKMVWNWNVGKVTLHSHEKSKKYIKQKTGNRTRSCFKFKDLMSQT